MFPVWIKRDRYEELLRKEATNDHLIGQLKNAELRDRDLKEEINRLHSRNDREQQRADNALQTMTAHKTGIAVPTPFVAPSAEDIDPHSEDPVLVEEIRERAKKEGIMSLLVDHGADLMGRS